MSSNQFSQQKKECVGKVSFERWFFSWFFNLHELRWLWGSCNSKSKNWPGEVQGMRVAELKKVLAEAERNGLSELCKISDVI